MSPPCADHAYFNAIVGVGGQGTSFAPFERDFCLTDVVLDLYSFPDGLASKSNCTIWLVRPSKSEAIFDRYIDKRGSQIHLTTGIVCPTGSHLQANVGVFVEGQTGNIRVLLSGYHC